MAVLSKDSQVDLSGSEIQCLQVVLNCTKGGGVPANKGIITTASLGQATTFSNVDPGQATCNIVNDVAVQTLSNKTLVSPVISGITAKSNASITASTTHTQAGATAVTVQVNEVTVSNASDSVVLPAAIVGNEIILHNSSGSLAMQVYANGSDTINGTAGATGVSQAAGALTFYVCVASGKWISK